MKNSLVPAPAAPASADLVRGLGWFSIALGMGELLAPKTLASAVGMDRGSALLSAYGVREITTGLGLLRAQDKGPWLWGRVGGDAMDIATLIASAATTNKRRGGAVMALLTVLGVTALDVALASAQSRASGKPLAPRTLRATSAAKRRLDARKAAAGLQ